MTALPHRIGRALAATALALGSVAVLATPASAAAPVAPTTADRVAGAAGWLARQLVDGTHQRTTYAGTTYDDPGLTADSVLAFAAAKVSGSAGAAATTWLSAHVADYAGDGATESYAGSLAKLALIAQVEGQNPSSFGSRNLLTDLGGREQGANGVNPGRFSDKSAYGDYSNAITQALALIVQVRAGTAPSRSALDSLESLQCADGGVRIDYPEAPTAAAATPTTTTTAGSSASPSSASAALRVAPSPSAVPSPSPSPSVSSADDQPANAPGFVAAAVTPCTSDPDATAFAAQALRAVGAGQQASAALDYLARAAAPGGGVASAAGVQNANTTGVAAAALISGARGASALQAFLVGLQQTAPASANGAIAFAASGYDATLAVRATSQAILGLKGTDLVTLTASGSTAAAPMLTTAAQLGGIPARVHAGDVLTVTISGLVANEGYRLELHSTVVVLGSGDVDAAGRATVNVRIPQDTTDGLHHVVVFGDDSGLSATAALFVIAVSRPATSTSATNSEPNAPTSVATVTTVPDGANPSPELSQTGAPANTPELVLIGSSAVVVGVLLLLLVARRRNGRAEDR